MVKGDGTKERRGGWKHTKYLTWSEVKDVHFITYQGRLNFCFDIMPESGADQERKRFIHTKAARIKQALKRWGITPVGYISFEKGGPSNADLHGHFQVHIPPKHYGIADRHADGFVVKATHLKTPSSRQDRASYNTKQRKPGPPEFERNCWHRYEKNPAPIPGKKISFTPGALALLESRDRAREIRQRETVAQIMQTGQIEMFPEINDPPSRLREYRAGILSPSVALELDFHRKRHGWTQKELGHRARLSQAQIANALSGRFGLSAEATARLKAVLLEGMAQQSGWG